jgi:hypothetical protein
MSSAQSVESLTLFILCAPWHSESHSLETHRTVHPRTPTETVAWALTYLSIP